MIDVKLAAYVVTDKGLLSDITIMANIAGEKSLCKLHFTCITTAVNKKAIFQSLSQLLFCEYMFSLFIYIFWGVMFFFHEVTYT